MGKMEDERDLSGEIVRYKSYLSMYASIVLLKSKKITAEVNRKIPQSTVEN